MPWKAFKMAIPCEESSSTLKLNKYPLIVTVKLLEHIIAEAMDKVVGKEGVITVEEASGIENELEVLRACNSIEDIFPLIL